MPLRRRIAIVATTVVLASAMSACGSDAAKPEVPEGGTGSAYNDAVIASDSHDEVVFDDGSQMLVAVVCDDAQIGGTVVTVISEGITPGIYSGVFDPTTGIDLQLDASVGGEATGQAPMTLDAEKYTVTFADLEGAVFDVSGCPS